MEIDENAIREIVANILKETGVTSGHAVGSRIIPGVFDDINKAINEAHKAHKVFMETSLETRRAMIKGMRQIAEDNVEQFARLAVEETGMGRYEDKIRKNLLAVRMTPGVEDLQPMSFSDDHGLTLTERAPYGVIGAIAPSTNP
ncbi:MAG: aldehyde dehydrogenase family protein, partial [Spirochaetales bacterium]|nr:aldehyde dehydrogenase family protein [Spirochaetales bacterium]